MFVMNQALCKNPGRIFFHSLILPTTLELKLLTATVHQSGKHCLIHGSKHSVLAIQFFMMVNLCDQKAIMPKICFVTTYSLKTLFDNGKLFINLRPWTVLYYMTVLQSNINKYICIHIIPHIYVQMNVFLLKLNTFLNSVTIIQNNFRTPF